MLLAAFPEKGDEAFPNPVIWTDFFVILYVQLYKLNLIVDCFPQLLLGITVIKASNRGFPMTSKNFSSKVIRDICL